MYMHQFNRIQPIVAPHELTTDCRKVVPPECLYDIKIMMVRDIQDDVTIPFTKLISKQSEAPNEYNCYLFPVMTQSSVSACLRYLKLQLTVITV